MAFQFSIVTGAGVPIYKQLIDQVRTGVVSEEIMPGYQLPSIRALAERIVVNPNTIAKAYNEMVRDGIIETSPGKGFFVAERRQRFTREERDRLLEAAVDSFVHNVVLLEFSREEILVRIDSRLRSLEPADR